MSGVVRVELKDIIFEDKARAAIMRGVDVLARAVRTTLGPKGRNVIFQDRFGPPVVTKDGVTVARQVEPQDYFERLGAQMVKAVASKTCDVAGDGTTTATVLAHAIFREGLKYVSAGHNPMALKRGIEKAVTAAVAQLKAISKDVEDHSQIEQVGTISANNDPQIGKLISEAMEKVGKEGVITVEESSGTETTLDVVEGMQFDRGFITPYFVSDVQRMEAVLEDPYILIYEKKISDFKVAKTILELILKAPQRRPILILAEEVDRDALATFVINKNRPGPNGPIYSCCVRNPAFGERRKDVLEDIAIATGGEAIMSAAGKKIEEIDIKSLGRAKKVIVTRDRTLIIQGDGDPERVRGRVAEIRKRLDSTTSEYDREKLQERLAKLVGGVAVINIGGMTEAEMKERAMRIDDALHATRAAVDEGIVPGGGVALLRCVEAVRNLELPETEKPGAEIILKALEEPARWIAQNGGYEGAVVVEKILESKTGLGFNAETGVYEDLMKAGIIDPTKVARSALQNAASVASLLLTTEAMIAYVPETVDPKAVQVVT